MKNYLTESMTEFWVSIIQELNTLGSELKILPNVLKQIAQYFGFETSFIYSSDHKDNFILLNFYMAGDLEPQLYDVLNLREELGDDLNIELFNRQWVAFDGSSVKGAMEQELSRLFSAESIILIPIEQKTSNLKLVVGLADRRQDRCRDQHLLMFAHAILLVLTNYLKKVYAKRFYDNSMNILNSILNNSGVNVYVTDFYTDEVLYMNQSMYSRHYKGEKIFGRKCWEVIFKDTSACPFCPRNHLLDEKQEPGKPYIWDLYKPDENTWWRVLSSAFYWVDGRLAQVVSSVDVTENKKNEERIRHYAEYDSLTKLGSRHKLLLDCDDGIERLKKEDRDGYLLFCDLDRFKEINDNLGHNAGDRLLQMVGTVFLENEQTKDRTYRYGGDEFIVLLFDETKEEADKLIDDLIQRFKKPWKLGKNEVICTLSVGVTHFPKDATTTSDLLHTADLEMYKRKQKNR